MRRFVALLGIPFLVASCGDSPDGASPRMEVVDTYMDTDEGDRKVLEQMVAAGADLGKATNVRWYVYFPTTEARGTFAPKAREAGWKVELLDGAVGTSWLALCSRRAVVDLEAVRSMRRAFAGWTEGLDADIDGWEAAITK